RVGCVPKPTVLRDRSLLRTSESVDADWRKQAYWTARGGSCPPWLRQKVWLRLVAWNAVLCRILHTGVLQKCAIIGDVAYESLTLHHNIYGHLARIFCSPGTRRTDRAVLSC